VDKVHDLHMPAVVKDQDAKAQAKVAAAHKTTIALGKEERPVLATVASQNDETINFAVDQTKPLPSPTD
jgi:hypothetical protein